MRQLKSQTKTCSVCGHVGKDVHRPTKPTAMLIRWTRELCGACLQEKITEAQAT